MRLVVLNTALTRRNLVEPGQTCIVDLIFIQYPYTFFSAFLVGQELRARSSQQETSPVDHKSLESRSSGEFNYNSAFRVYLYAHAPRDHAPNTPSGGVLCRLGWCYRYSKHRGKPVTSMCQLRSESPAYVWIGREGTNATGAEGGQFFRGTAVGVLLAFHWEMHFGETYASLAWLPGNQNGIPVPHRINRGNE